MYYVINRFNRSIIKKENPSTVFYEDDEVLSVRVWWFMESLI
jgi:hypothetical protein